MLIVNDTRDRVVNVDNVIEICVEGSNIAAYVSGDSIILGKYEGGRSKEVFAELLEKAFPPSAMVLKNCTPTEEVIKALGDRDTNVILVADATGSAEVSRLDCSVYYMPKE